MKKLLTLFAFALSLGATDYSTVRSGNWNNTDGAGAQSPWCSVGVCAIPTFGDRVAITSGHTLTIPSGYTAQVGDNPASDSTATIGNSALRCVTNSSTTAVLVVNGTLEYAGPVRQCGATWTVNGGAALKPAGTSVSYSWSTVNPTSGTVGKLVLNGSSGNRITVQTKSGTTRGAAFGIYATGGTNLNGNGNIDCSYTDFIDIGAGTGDAYWGKPNNSITPVWNNCTFTNSGTVQMTFQSGTAGWDVTGLDVSNTTGSTNGSVFVWANAATTSATRIIRNSVIEGKLSTSCSTNDSLLTLENVISRVAGTDGASMGTCSGTASGLLYYSQVTVDSRHQWQQGTTTDSAMVRYIVSGQGNEHPSGLDLRKTSTFTRMVFDGNADLTSDMFEAANNPSSTLASTFTHFAGLCTPDDLPTGSAFNYDGGSGTMNNARISFTNGTWCAGLVDAADNLVMAVGAEGAITLGAGIFANVSNNVWWRPTSGVVRGICLGGGGLSANASTFTTVGNNNTYNSTTSAYCTNATSAGVSASNDTSNAPRFVDTTRNFARFDTQFLRESVVASQWTNASTYNAGDEVWDQQSTVYGNVQINWRATATCVASSTNRPITGTGWTDCWEPRSYSRMRSAVLAGTTYNGLTAVTAYVRWVLGGLVPQNPALWAAGSSGTYQGAGDPTNLRNSAGAAAIAQ